MMNAYKEVEDEKLDFGQQLKEKIEKIKESIKNNPYSYAKLIKKAEKVITELTPEDEKNILLIDELIAKHDICDSNFGPTIDYQSLCRFINIASQNENMQEVVKRATAWQSIYAEHKEKIEKDSSENSMSL